MTSVLLISCIVIGAVGAFNVFLTFGLVSRVRALQEAVQEGVFVDTNLPQPGQRIGEFSITTLAGKTISERDLAGTETLVGFFTSGCKPCKNLRAELERTPPALPFIAFVDGDDDDPEVDEIVASLARFARVAVVHADDAVTRAFKPTGFPTLIRTDNGLVAAAGHRLRQVM
jgi:thiol-disulfide isomerase/thioredoxin